MSRGRRSELVAAAQATIGSGINQGTSGNLSLREGDGMLITPSGLPYDRMSEADIVFLGLGSGAEAPSAEDRKPSSEWRIHRDVYRARSDAHAILHAHPVHCVALAALRRPLPAFHYMVAAAGGSDIRCAPYATFGTQQLSEHVLVALQGRRACLMANHGVLCLGPNLEKVLALTLEIELLARAYLLCLGAGDPVVLDDDEMDRVVEKFRDYGA